MKKTKDRRDLETTALAECVKALERQGKEGRHVAALSSWEVGRILRYLADRFGVRSSQ